MEGHRHPLLESLPAAMKYYIYISDAKVDMLFPQVPHDIKKKVATEWKMDLKLLSASRRVETESEDNRIARLETVVEFIRRYGNLGSIEQPDQFVEDILPMRWGPLGDGDIQLVYFAGKVDHTVVGLGGSMKHVIGSSLKGGCGMSAEPTLALEEIFAREGKNEIRDSLASDDRESERDAFELVLEATRSTLGPLQLVDFMAKRLMFWNGDVWPGESDNERNRLSGTRILLATPLYVALVD